MKLIRIMLTLGVGLALCAPAMWSKQVELSFLSYFIAKDEALGRSIIADFEKANPDIKVNLEVMRGSDGAPALVRIAAGTPPDVIDIHPSLLYEFIKKGVFSDITEPARRDADLNDFFAPILSSVSLNGRIYALPQRISTYVLFYNSDMFDNAGINYPSRSWYDTSWNWDAFYTAGRKLRRDTNGDGKYDLFGASINTVSSAKLLTWLFQAGNRIFDSNYTRFELGNEAGLQAIDFVQRGFIEEVFTTESSASRSFQNGIAAMAVDIPPTMLTYKASAKFGFDVAALPQGPAGPGTTIQPIPFGVVAASQNQEAAWRFLNYFTNRANSEQFSKAGVIVQPRKSVATNLRSYPDIGLRDLAPFLGAMEVGTPVPNSHIKFAEICAMIDKALNPVWKGTQNARTALASIKGAVEELLKVK